MSAEERERLKKLRVELRLRRRRLRVARRRVQRRGGRAKASQAGAQAARDAIVAKYGADSEEARLPGIGMVYQGLWKKANPFEGR